MIYTVTPLERIYANRNMSEENEEEELKTISLSHGRVYMKRKGNDYVIDGIQSTDMSDYLSKDYTLGEKYQTGE